MTPNTRLSGPELAAYLLKKEFEEDKRLYGDSGYCLVNNETVERAIAALEQPSPTIVAEIQEKVVARLKETKDSRDMANMKKLIGVDSEAAKEWEYLKDSVLQLEWVVAILSSATTGESKAEPSKA